MHLGIVINCCFVAWRVAGRGAEQVSVGRAELGQEAALEPGALGQVVAGQDGSFQNQACVLEKSSADSSAVPCVHVTG